MDVRIAQWFHERLTVEAAQRWCAVSWAGSGLWIGIVLGMATLGLAWKRRWDRLAWAVITVPGGILLAEWVKVLVQRQRPYVAGPFASWDGYSFPSGHTIGAMLLYGMLVLLLAEVLERWWRAAAALAGGIIVALVACSRVALGAHYVSDVIGAMVMGCVWLVICSILLEGVLRYRPSWRTGKRAEKATVDTTHGAVFADDVAGSVCALRDGSSSSFFLPE